MTIKVKNPTTGVVNAVTPTQTTTLQNDLQIPTLISQGNLSVSVSATSQIQQATSTLSLNGLAGTGGLLASTNVGPVTIGSTTYANLLLALIALDLKAGQGGTPLPSAPVKNTVPTVAFPGGSGDAGEVPVLTMATPFTGTTTSIDVQIIYNGVVDQTITGATNGMNLPALKASLITGARFYGINLLGNWAGGTAVSNPSTTYTLNVSGIPVVSTVPLIAPSTATELTTLVPTQGVYTVNGGAVNNSTLTFTYRWTADWTLTAALVAATSSTFTTVWSGSTGSYTVIFSDGSTKVTTLTNGAATFSWTGAVTATTAVKVQLATTAILALNTNNIGHAIRYYETPTGAGGVGTEQQASNTITPTSSSAGGAGTVESGHQWLVSLLATGPISWADYQTQRALYSPDGGRTSQDAQAWVASIPSSGGVTLAAGSTSAQIISALAANTIVFLSQGTYNPTAMITIPANKWLIGLGTGAFFDCSGQTTSPYYGFRLLSSSNLVNTTVYRARDLSVWLSANNANMYKVSGQQAGVNSTTNGAVGMYYSGANDCIAVSCESIGTIYGGDADGWDVSRTGESNNTFVDCHAIGNDDDGFDTWTSNGRHFFHYCKASAQGANIITAGTVAGDGNGFKLGGPINSTPIHFLNQCTATNNLKFGFNYNGTVSGNKHILRLCTASGNGSGTYAFGGTIDNNQYVLVNS